MDRCEDLCATYQPLSITETRKRLHTSYYRTSCTPYLAVASFNVLADLGDARGNGLTIAVVGDDGRLLLHHHNTLSTAQHLELHLPSSSREWKSNSTTSQQQEKQLDRVQRELLTSLGAVLPRTSFGQT